MINTDMILINMNSTRATLFYFIFLNVFYVDVFGSQWGMEAMGTADLTLLIRSQKETKKI